MEEYKWRRSGQIPAFGDWEHANQLPITQYFETARQAGLIRYSSSSGECDPHPRGGDLYAVDHHQARNGYRHPRKARLRENKHSGPQVKEQRRQKGQGKVFDVTDPAKQQKRQQQPLHHHYNTTNQYQYQYQIPKQPKNPIYKVPSDVGKVAVPDTKLPVRPPKPVDEDLYKISPELLRSSKRSKMPGIFSCLVPACAS